jgi:hypothetical protein
LGKSREEKETEGDSSITMMVAITKVIGKTIKCMEKGVCTTRMATLPMMVIGIWTIFTEKVKSLMTAPNAFPIHLTTKQWEMRKFNNIGKFTKVTSSISKSTEKAS